MSERTDKILLRIVAEAEMRPTPLPLVLHLDGLSVKGVLCSAHEYATALAHHVANAHCDREDFVAILRDSVDEESGYIHLREVKVSAVGEAEYHAFWRGRLDDVRSFSLPKQEFSRR